jgi:hypothetical protein
MKIEQIKTEKLIPYINNARTHSEQQVAQIAASIREFGFNNPIIVDKNFTIIAGHGRVRAAQLLEMEKVPCIQVEHLTELQKKAYILAENKIALNAGWDNELLSLELHGLEESEFDLQITGFNDAEISMLFSDGQGTDAKQEWTGMPEFISNDPCYRKVVVNFDTPDDVQEFFSMIGQSFTEKTKSIWFPEKENRDLKDVRYATDED